MNYLKSLMRKYDKDIRLKCEKKRLLLIKCLTNSFNDYFICSQYINDFETCVNEFDKSFKSKYNLK
jgi:hypothetical protein